MIKKKELLSELKVTGGVSIKCLQVTKTSQKTQFHPKKLFWVQSSTVLQVS